MVENSGIDNGSPALPATFSGPGNSGWHFGLGVWGLGFGVWSLGYRNPLGFGLQVLDIGFGV